MPRHTVAISVCINLSAEFHEKKFRSGGRSDVKTPSVSYKLPKSWTRGQRVMSSSIVPLKIRRVEDRRCTLNLPSLKLPPISMVWKLEERCQLSCHPRHLT
ncbi:hypothetical protein TNCV_4458841 [Trichonephila clavipes]|nr:hypothetical protein TNCV_4458841 [Trichonephila clavipes]